MPQNFIECDRDQELLLPPSMREWLPEDHLAWFVADAVEEMDLQAFYGAYRDDGWGRAAFEPQMMVALLLYAYAVGERSSRGIERRCREDVAFRVLAANQIPDHATIARFRARHEQALADTFTQVLALCANAGLVSVGVVALDGSLISANASPAATRAYPHIRAEVERMLEEAAATDQREDTELGETRGDELPEGLANRRSRRERLRRCREELEAAHAAELRAHEGHLERRAAWEAEHGRKLTGRKPAPPAEDALQKAKINTADPDSRPLRRTGTNLVQGYNAQVLAASGQVILAADLTQSPVDSTELTSMVVKAGEELQSAGVGEPIGTILADGGYWSAPQIAAIRERGTEVIIPTRNARRRAPRKLAAKQGPEAERIERVLATPEGQALYRRRAQIVEPIFANTKFIRGADRFQRRGLDACRAEWKLLAATHNLLKLWRAGLARPAPA
jgi:transposase